MSTNKTKCFQVGGVTNCRLRVNRKSEPLSYEAMLEMVGALDTYASLRINNLQVGEHFHLPCRSFYYSIRRVALKTPINSSSWIGEVLYKPTPDSNYLAIFLSNEPVALLYRGVSPQIPGLLQAGLGGLSVGKAYNKLVKGKYEYTRVEGQEKVNELRKMMVLG